MIKETFCDKYCPIPVHYTEVNDQSDTYTECDLEESECPFKDVDFSKVEEKVL